MTLLAMVGPQIVRNAHDDFDRITFRHADLDPLVGELYSVVGRSARRSGIDVSYPTILPGQSPRDLWVKAVHRLADADAVFAVFIGESPAIPTEASLARMMEIPLVVAAIDIDTYFTDPWQADGVPVFDARLEADAGEKAMQTLFGQGMSMW